MRTLLTTTALVALFSMGAVAQDAAPASDSGSDLLTQGYELIDTDALASTLLGFPVYSSAEADAEQLGEINDIVVGEDGNVAAVILGVGGFLGVGEKNVAIDYNQLQWTVAEDETERLVLEVSREQLETAQAVELVDDQPMDTAESTDTTVIAEPPADDQAAQTAATETEQPVEQQDEAMQTAETETEPVEQQDEAMQTAETDQQQPADQQDDAMQTAQVETETEEAVDVETETGAIGDPAAGVQPGGAMDTLNRETLVDFDETALTAEDLIGINVYGPSNEHIGVIGDFVLGEDDGVDAVIIDFGGFLGIGTKQVAIAYEDLDFYADENGDNRYLILNVTREMMEQAPEFNSDTYAQERDTQRLVLDGSDTAAAN